MIKDSGESLFKATLLLDLYNLVQVFSKNEIFVTSVRGQLLLKILFLL